MFLKIELNCQLSNNFFFCYCKVIVFTIQRLFLVYKPMYKKFQSTKSAWNFLILITIIAFCLNSWSLFVFKIQGQYVYVCDVDKSLVNTYFFINIIYIFLVVMIIFCFLYSIFYNSYYFIARFSYRC